MCFGLDLIGLVRISLVRLIWIGLDWFELVLIWFRLVYIGLDWEDWFGLVFLIGLVRFYLVWLGSV